MSWVSKPRRGRSGIHEPAPHFDALPTWKSAIWQTSKSALHPAVSEYVTGLMAQLTIASANATFPPIGSSYCLNSNEVLATVDLRRHSLGMGNAWRRQRDEFDLPEQVAASGAGSTGEGLIAEIGAWDHDGLAV